MKLKRDTKKMNEYNTRRGDETRDRVSAAIDQCRDEKNISLARVCEIAGVNRNYFSRHPEAHEALDRAMGVVSKRTKKVKQNDDSKNAIINALTKKVKSLQKKNEKLSEYEKYKNMYEDLLVEMEKLKKQLNDELNRKFNEGDLLNF